GSNHLKLCRSCRDRRGSCPPMPGTQVTCRPCAILIILRQLAGLRWCSILQETSAFGMELFLNLCWLSLLVPACLLWRQRNASPSLNGRAKSPAPSPLVFLCVLGCALVLLFPVISASDDLHAMRAEMEESERAFRHASHGASTSHAL